MLRSRLSAVGAGALVASLALGTGMALSSSGTDDTSYTGCLKNGKIQDVAVGAEPLEPCGTDAQTVIWNASGRDGATWFSGVSAPEAALGQNGDLFLLLDDINTADAGDVFVKQDGTWVTQATLRGPQGPQGEQGPQGPQGEQGEPGEDGGIYQVRLFDLVEVNATDTVVLRLDVPAGRYADVRAQISWQSNHEDSSPDGGISCDFGGTFGGGDSGRPAGQFEMSTISGETIVVDDDGLEVTCSHDISADVTVGGRGHTWIRATPVADYQEIR